MATVAPARGGRVGSRWPVGPEVDGVAGKRSPRTEGRTHIDAPDAATKLGRSGIPGRTGRTTTVTNGPVDPQVTRRSPR
jgi:hypothetical protein